MNKIDHRLNFNSLFSFLCRLCTHRPGRVVGSALPCQHCQPVLTGWSFEPGQKQPIDAPIVKASQGWRWFISRICCRQWSYIIWNPIWCPVLHAAVEKTGCTSQIPPDATTATGLWTHGTDLMLCCYEDPSLSTWMKSQIEVEVFSSHSRTCLLSQVCSAVCTPWLIF